MLISGRYHRRLIRGECTRVRDPTVAGRRSGLGCASRRVVLRGGVLWLND